MPMTLRVYTVDPKTLERGPAREVHPQATEPVFASCLAQWPTCSCLRCRTNPEHAARVATAEKGAAR